MGEFAAAPKGGLAGFVERSLKQALLEGRLRPGERLVTREFADQLGTSLTPVREALLKLVAAGALEGAPSQSFQVPLMTEAGYREIADIRTAVEGLAAERAAQVIRPETIATLRDLNAEFRAAKREGEIAHALALNKSFRFTLYESAVMPRLLEVIERLWLQIGPSLNFLYPQPKPGRFTRHNYDVLLDALERRDGVGVRRAIEQAIDAGMHILLANMVDTKAVALVALP